VTVGCQVLADISCRGELKIGGAKYLTPDMMTIPSKRANDYLPLQSGEICQVCQVLESDVETNKIGRMQYVSRKTKIPVNFVNFFKLYIDIKYLTNNINDHEKNILRLIDNNFCQ